MASTASAASSSLRLSPIEFYFPIRTKFYAMTPDWHNLYWESQSRHQEGDPIYAHLCRSALNEGGRVFDDQLNHDSFSSFAGFGLHADEKDAQRMPSLKVKEMCENAFNLPCFRQRRQNLHSPKPAWSTAILRA